ncbi:MAG TPA: hypothetical protein VFJ57_01265 [Solirubrobacterales bacterium]|nr:hypothetical protein [Solirubrobacterales bacterium]
MSLPGVTVKDRESAVASSPPLDTATSFVVGLAERGPVGTAVKCRSRAQFESVYGGEVSYGYLWDAANVIPKEGGGDIYFSRVVGPAAKASTVKLSDGSGNTLQVDAASPGAWGDDIDVKVTVPGGGNFVLAVIYKGATVETSPPLANNAEAVLWAEHSEYVRLKDLGGSDPAAAEAALTGGTDDRGNITDTERKAALAALTRDLGAGQVAYPGGTSTAIHTALLEHAEDYNRCAILDATDTATVATLTGEAATLRALGTSARCGGLFAPWAVVKGSAVGTTKTVPYSLIQMGIIARHDGLTYDAAAGVTNPNDPAAGVNGVSLTTISLSQPAWTEVNRETLNDAGVNVARVVYGQVRTYGYRTLVNPLTDGLHLWLNNRRIDMAILAKAALIGEEFVFAEVDGRGQVLGTFAGALRGEILAPYYQVGALFGATPEDAFWVDVGDAVNPPEQLAEGIFRAVIAARRSPLAEQVEIEYVKEEVA